MASLIYGKCYLWQMHYGKSIMANETEPKKSYDLRDKLFYKGSCEESRLS